MAFWKITHTWVGPTVRAKSLQHIFWWLSSTSLFTLHTTRSQLHFHTTTSSSLPLPCPYLLTHIVTDRSSANPCHPDLENTLLAPLHRSSSLTFFSAFSPLRRYFIHLSLIYTSDLLVIGWHFIWFRYISTHKGWLMVGWHTIFGLGVLRSSWGLHACWDVWGIWCFCSPSILSPPSAPLMVCLIRTRKNEKQWVRITIWKNEKRGSSTVFSKPKCQK